jgi:copper chaperone
MYTFHVPKMSCGGCASNIKKAIEKLDSHAHIDFDLASKTVKVESDVAVAIVVKAMTDAGYQPAPQ